MTQAKEKRLAGAARIGYTSNSTGGFKKSGEPRHEHRVAELVALTKQSNPATGLCPSLSDSNMSLEDPFVQHLKHELVPRLRGDGFRGSFPRFQRVTEELVHEIDIQGWRYGGQRTINLSLGFTFIQLQSNGKYYDTEYSYRIGTSGGRDRWWHYSKVDPVDCVIQADAMIAVFDREASSFFSRFNRFPDSFTHYSPSDFVEAPQSYLLPRVGGGRMVARDCWIFTQIWQHLGDQQRAADFATMGIEYIGNAGALRKTFEQAISDAEIVG